MGDDRGGRRSTLLFDCLVVGVAEQLRHQGLGSERGSAEHERNGVAETSLELAPHPRWVGARAALGGVADEHLAVVSCEHDRRDDGADVAERDDLGSTVAGDRCRGERGTEIDAEDVVGAVAGRGSARGSELLVVAGSRCHLRHSSCRWSKTAPWARGSCGSVSFLLVTDHDRPTDERFERWVADARTIVAGRPDLVDAVDAEVSRAARDTCVVAVVGEFKQGKSSLVNALLGEAVCPTDDHLATSTVTVVANADVPTVTLQRRAADGTVTSEAIDPGRRADVIVEPGAVGDGGTVERVDIGIPNPLLSQSLVLVDTPGVGGLRPAHAAATRAFLRSADALVFVTDATSELTLVEIEFLRDAAGVCPEVLVAATKTDLFPEWPRVVERSRAHLASVVPDAPTFPLSSQLRVEAVRRRDRALDTESGFPALAEHLLTGTVPRALATSRRRAVAGIVRLADQVAVAESEEAAVLRDPAATAERLEELHARRDQLARLSEGAARWRTVLSDRTADLSHDVTHTLRASTRAALEAMDAAIDEAGSADEMAAAGEALQRSMVDAASSAFDAVEQGVVDIAAEIAGELGVDQLDVVAPDEIAESGRSAAAAWRDPSAASKKRTVVGDTLTAVRGAQGGVLMFAVMGGLLPAAAATAVAAAPFMIGAGVLFGGKQIVDLRRQRRGASQQQVKVALRKSVDELQFTVNAELTEALRVAQRHLRDELGGRIEELHRTTSAEVDHLQAAAQADAEQRERRASGLEQRAAAIADWRNRAGAAS